MQNQGNFDAALSQMYDDVTEAEYYSLFFGSIFHYLQPFDIQRKKVLDIGCGNGKLCQRFIAEGAGATLGIDISADQIKTAKSLAGKNSLFQVKDAYVSFDLEQQFEVVSCIYALHFIKDYATLKIACQNIFRHLTMDGIAVILDITHDYVYDKSKMEELKQLTMYEYIPNVVEGQIPTAWETVKGRVHTSTEVLTIDHIAIHGSNLIQALKEVGFTNIERKPFVHTNQYYVDLWGPDGFNHHLIYCRK